VNGLARLIVPAALACGACGTVGGTGAPDAGGGHGSDGGGSASGVVLGAYKDTGINLDFNTNTISTLVPGARTPLATDLTANHARAVTLAFATGACGKESWAGVDGATLAHVNAPLLDAAGVSYVVSTGGAAGAFTCASDADFATFLARWMSPHLVGVDFDLEVSQPQAVITDLVRRIAPAHAAHPGLRFSLTIATLANTDGAESLNATGAAVVQTLHDELGTLPSYVTINLMTMNYGTASPSVCVVDHGACEMGQSAVQAARNLHASHGIAFANLELTPMIGGNNVQGNVFTLADVATVASFATQDQLAGVHFWAYDRDTDCAAGAASPTCNSLGGAGAHGFLHQFQAAGL
jgi:chitinase